MTERRQRFVTEYLKDGNGTQAAIRAGFSAKTAGPAAGRLLKDVQVATAIAEARAPIVAGAGVTYENHIAKLAELRDLAEAAKQYNAAIAAETARGKVAGLYVEQVADVTKLTDEQLDAIAAGKTRAPLRLAS